MKNAVFWDMTPCGSYKNRRFVGTYRLHHQGEENRRARNDVSNNVRPKRRFFQEPYGVTSQKTVFFIVITVKTSELMYQYKFYVE
jgi:hypothetical protein